MDQVERDLLAMRRLGDIQRQDRKNIRVLRLLQRVTRSRFGATQIAEAECRINRCERMIQKIVDDNLDRKNLEN